MKLRHFSIFLAVAAIFSIFAIKTIAADAAAPTANAAPESATNEIKEAKPPTGTFTNYAGMLMLKVGDGLWAGKYEVTQKQFVKVMESNPSQFIGDDYPVDSVSWGDAVNFCRRMTELDVEKKVLPKGFYYTLPTEDEWKMLMADAGLDSAVTSVNHATRSGPNPVGSLAPNSLGLYDTRGNVMEFILSDESKPFRILKGGSWTDFAEVNLRPEFRWYCKTDERKNTFGFRCILKNDPLQH